MKNFKTLVVMVFIMLCLSENVCSQDVITLTNGEKIYSVIKKFTDSAIIFKKYKEKENPYYLSVNISSVNHVVFDNGKVWRNPYISLSEKPMNKIQITSEIKEVNKTIQTENWRNSYISSPLPEKSIDISQQNSGIQTVNKPVQTVVTQTVKKEVKKQDKSMYFSTRYRIGFFSDEPYPSLTSEIGALRNKFFGSGSVSYLPEFIGGGVSFGARTRPHKNIQIITGLTGGYWKLDENEFFGGAFAKALFGKKKWCEIQNRFLFGIDNEDKFAVGYQIGIGFTFTK